MELSHTAAIPKPALSLVIPVYNSAPTLTELVAHIGQLAVPGSIELILVNDGSKDESGEVCSTLAKSAAFPITVINLSRNFGEHNAVMAGLCRARGSHTIVMDDDLQNPLHEVPRLLAKAQSTGCDVLYTFSESPQHSTWRRLGSGFANFVADLLLDKPRGLYLSSFKCLSEFTVSQVIAYKGPFPYLDGLILQVANNLQSMKVDHHSRLQGKSGYTLRKLTRLWLNILCNFSIMPLRVATLIGLCLAGLGLAGATLVIAEALLFDTPSGWGSLMASILIFSGIQLTMLGVFGEYLGRIHLTLNNKPQFIVRNVLAPDVEKK